MMPRSYFLKYRTNTLHSSMLVHETEPYAYLNNGQVIYYDQPPSNLDINLRQIRMRTRHSIFHQNKIIYYDPFLKSLMSIDDLIVTPLRPIRAYIPDEFVHLMTATTPFYLHSQTIHLVSRGMVWTFYNRELDSLTPLMCEQFKQYFDYSKELIVQMNKFDYSVYQKDGNVIYNNTYYQPNKTLTHYDSYTVFDVQETGIIIMKDGEVVYKVEDKHWTRLEQGYDEYVGYYMRMGTRLVERF